MTRRTTDRKIENPLEDRAVASVDGRARAPSAPTAGEPDWRRCRAPSSPSCPIAAIRPNPRQPRTVFDEDEHGRAGASIREIGVLQPVVVRRIPDRPTDGPTPASTSS